MQEEEKLQSIAQYDLGLIPKLRKSDKMKSLSMPNVVQTVQPVESAGSSKAIQVKAFDSPKVPIKKKAIAPVYNTMRIEDFAISNRLLKSDMNNGRKKVLINETFPIFSLDEA